MTISIVIPCFNHGRFLAEAIESALAQAWPAIDVVVVDDGSTDDSAAIARRYGDVRLVRQANCGLAHARNAGLHTSRGEIVIFLDADDRLLPGAARAAVTAFNDSPAAVMAFGRCRLIDEEGRPMATDLPRVDADHYLELLRRNYIWMPAMAAYRRLVFDGIGGFDSRVDPSADYDMYLRIVRTCPVVAHPTTVADYRQHGANMSRDPVLMLDATLSVLERQRRFIRGDPRLMTAYRQGIRHWREFYGEQLVERFRTALHSGDRRSAARDAVQLLRLYPRGVRRHLWKKARLVTRASGRRRDAGSGDLLREAPRV